MGKRTNFLRNRLSLLNKKRKADPFSAGPDNRVGKLSRAFLGIEEKRTWRTMDTWYRTEVSAQKQVGQ